MSRGGYNNRGGKSYGRGYKNNNYSYSNYNDQDYYGNNTSNNKGNYYQDNYSTSTSYSLYDDTNKHGGGYVKKQNHFKKDYVQSQTYKENDRFKKQTNENDYGSDRKFNDQHEFNPNEDCYDDEFDGVDCDYDEEDYGGEVDFYGNEIKPKGSTYKEEYEAPNKLQFDNKTGFTEYVNQIISKEYKKSYEINDGYVNILMIAEKPSIAKAISVALGDGKYKSKTIGKGKAILTFDGYFHNIKAKFTVSSVMGHVYTSDFKKEHNDWNSIDPLDLFNAPIVKLEANRKTRIPGMLSKLAQGKDILALWLDCDKEGENICFETLYCCYNQMNKKNYQQVFRAKFSSLTNQDLKKAMNNMEALPNYKESLAVDARQHIDLKIGIAFTRFLTKTILPILNIEGLTLISYGPCQTPTLWFCVNRENEITSFKSKQIFRVYIEYFYNKMKYKVLFKPELSKQIKIEKGDYFDKKKSEVIMTYLKSIPKGTQCKVINVSINKQMKSPPVGLNTVAMLRTASSYLKMSPQQTMHIAERLYTSGYITYPRTETTKYNPSFDFYGLLCQLKGIANKELSAIICNLCNNFKKPILRGADVGDHPPITPSKFADGLSGESARLYEFIVSHFVATMMESAEYEERQYFIEYGNETFSAESKILTKEGFLSLFKWKKEKYNEFYPQLKIGDLLDISQLTSDSIWTSPPDYLSESDLLKLMEQNGIGTDASMAVHIENITNRQYVTVDSNRRLKPTALGKALISGLSSVDEELVIPKLRAEIEKNVTEICKGTQTYKQILENSLESYRKKLVLVRQSYEKLIKGFSKNFSINYSNMSALIQKIRLTNEEENIKNIKQKGVNEVRDKIIRDCQKCVNSSAKIYIDYDKFDKFVLHCTKCKYREKIIRDAILVDVIKDKICENTTCKANLVYIEVENPFLNGDTFIKGCLFCDPSLK